jgi:hypothetical protein
MKVADFVGYVQMSGRDRVLDFNPTDRWIGKNPAGWAPWKVPPVAKAQTFLAELYVLGREALGNLSAESAEIANQVETWKTKIAGLTTPEGFTEQGPLVGALPPILKAQVWKLLTDAATAKGYTFDKTAKAFSAPAEQPAGAVA